MTVTKELEMLIANEHSNIKSVDVQFNGEIMSGFIKNAKFLPVELTLCKHETAKNEYPYYTVDFNAAKKLTVIFFDGSTKSFE